MTKTVHNDEIQLKLNVMKESYQSTCYQRFRHIASFPADEIPADYPHKFINNVINNLQEKSKETDDYVIPPGFLHVLRNVVLVDIPHCPKNEKLAKHFIKKFDIFTDNKYGVRITWTNEKVKRSFKLKSRDPYSSWCILQR